MRGVAVRELLLYVSVPQGHLTFGTSKLKDLPKFKRLYGMNYSIGIALLLGMCWSVQQVLEIILRVSL